MKIEQIQTVYYRLPLEPMGDAGHGAIDSEELITLTLHAEGLVGPAHVGVLQRHARFPGSYAAGTELALNSPAHVAEDGAGCSQSGAVESSGETHIVLIHLSPLDVAAQLD